jgi:hypothetical protein
VAVAGLGCLAAAGVSVLSITGGHVPAPLAEALARPLGDVSAVVANLDERATVIETGETIAVGTPGQAVRPNQRLTSHVHLLPKSEGGPTIAMLSDAAPRTNPRPVYL